MTKKQLEQIKKFSKPYYLKNDQFHSWEHPILTTKYALMLARPYKNVDLNVVEAACYLHDIGRNNKDEGHAYESAKIAKPFLEQIKLSEREIEIIINAVYNHGVEDIDKVKSLEGKLLFDADKIQILSVYGFIRVYSFLVVQRKWMMKKSLDFMYEYVKDTYKYLQTPLAKKMLKPEMEKIKHLMEDFNSGLTAKLSSHD